MKYLIILCLFVPAISMATNIYVCEDEISINNSGLSDLTNYKTIFSKTNVYKKKQKFTILEDGTASKTEYDSDDRDCVLPSTYIVNIKEGTIITKMELCNGLVLEPPDELTGKWKLLDNSDYQKGGIYENYIVFVKTNPEKPTFHTSFRINKKDKRFMETVNNLNHSSVRIGNCK